jgi:ABC-type dipeptide/oligopeptide/nickel transport system permease component
MNRSILLFLLIAFMFTLTSAAPIDPTGSRVEEPVTPAVKSRVQLSNKELRKMSSADLERIMGRDLSDAEKIAFKSNRKKFVHDSQMVEIRKTNTLAILAFAGGLLLGPVGIVLGIIALRQIKKRNEAGRGWAIAGIVIGAVVTLLFLSLGAMGGWFA